MKKYVLLSVAALLLGFSSFAEDVDKRVKNLLDGNNFKYKVSRNGNFRIVVDVGKSRSQMLFIDSNTEKFGDMEIREIWSIGYEGDMTASVMKKMLQNSLELKIGAWCISKDKGIFVAKVPAQMPWEELRGIIFLVGETADELEHDVIGTDTL